MTCPNFGISIITPTYDGLPYIVETVASVLESSRRLPEDVGFEYIVVDDGSRDSTASVLMERFGNAITLITQDNCGEACSVNRGVALAAYDVVCIVNADDPVYPNLFPRAVEVLRANPTLVGAYPDWDMIDEHGAIVRHVRTREFNLDVHLGEFFCIPGPGGFFKRSALAGEEPRDQAIRYASDYDMWLRLGLRGPLARIPEVLATWRQHASGASAAARNPQMAANRMAVIRKLDKRDDVPRDVLSLRRRAMGYAYYGAGLLAVHNSSIPGRRYLVMSLLLLPRWPRDRVVQQPRAWGHMLYVFGSPFSRWLYRYLVGRRDSRAGMAGDTTRQAG